MQVIAILLKNTVLRTYWIAMGDLIFAVIYELSYVRRLTDGRDKLMF